MAAKEAKELTFKDIVAANQRRILAIARSYARGDECQDLCQDILLQMWRGLDHFAGRSAPSTWVYRVALNTAITCRRKNGRRVEPSGRPLTDSVPEPMAPASAGNEI